jgi:hypothetical protein
VVYVPIDYAKRAGKSKFRFVTDAYRYILQVLRMIIASMALLADLIVRSRPQ